MNYPPPATGYLPPVTGYQLPATSHQPTNGLLACARYALSPNLLHYCGPEKQRDLLAYVKEGITDRGLAEILHKFETLYPYLVLIAQANNIRDPFDIRVVEAYWLGNDLLKKVKQKDYVLHLSETLLLRKKLTHQQHSVLIDHIHDGLPHHTFHVLNVFLRTGVTVTPQTLETMDSCRIGWGKVLSVNGQTVRILTRPLVTELSSIKLGKPVRKTVEAIGPKPVPGDIITYHWGTMCTRIPADQARLLFRYTQSALDHANGMKMIC